MPEIDIKGFCEDCESDVTKIDYSYFDGDTLVVEFRCCGKIWRESYSWAGRTSAADPEKK